MGWSHLGTDPASSAPWRSKGFHHSDGRCGEVPQFLGTEAEPLALQQRREPVGIRQQPNSRESVSSLATVMERPRGTCEQDLGAGGEPSA